MDAYRYLRVILFIILHSFFPGAFAEDLPEKVVLFVGTNTNSEEFDSKGNYGEILAARRAVARRNSERRPGEPREVLVAMTGNGVHRYDEDKLSGNRLVQGARKQMMAFDKTKDPEAQAKVEAFDVKINEIRKQMDLMSEDNPKLTTLRDQFLTLVRGQAKVAGPGGINQSSLEDVLRMLEKGEGFAGGGCAGVSSMIVSGHQADRKYFGTSGGVSQKQIGNAFKKHSCTKDGLKSIILPACYSGVKGSCSAEWQDFEDHEFTFAYDALAPLADKESGQLFIQSALENEAELRSRAEAFKEVSDAGFVDDETKKEVLELSVDAIEDVMKKIVGANVGNLAGICMGGKKYFENPEIHSIHFRRNRIQRNPNQESPDYIFDLEHECPKIFLGLRDGFVNNSGNKISLEMYQDYYAGILEPPNQTGESSPLRQFYGSVNEFLSCANIQNTSVDPPRPYSETDVIPPTHEIIALIHFRKVLDNFILAHGDELETSIEDLKLLLEYDDEFIKGKLKDANGDVKADFKDIYQDFVEQRNKLAAAIVQLERIKNDKAKRHEIVEAPELLQAWYEGRRPGSPNREFISYRSYDLKLKDKNKDNLGNQELARMVGNSMRRHLVELDPDCMPSDWIDAPQVIQGKKQPVRTRCEGYMRLGVEARQTQSERRIFNDPELNQIDQEAQVADWFIGVYQEQLDLWASGEEGRKQSGREPSPIEEGERILAALQAGRALKARDYYLAKKSQVANQLYWGEEYDKRIEAGTFKTNYDKNVQEAKAALGPDQQLFDVLYAQADTAPAIRNETRIYVARQTLMDEQMFTRMEEYLRSRSDSTDLANRIAEMRTQRAQTKTVLKNYIKALGGDPGVSLKAASQAVVNQNEAQQTAISAAVRAALAQEQTAKTGSSAQAASPSPLVSQSEVTRSEMDTCKSKGYEGPECAAVRALVYGD